MKLFLYIHYSITLLQQLPMDPNFDPSKLASASDKMVVGGNKNRAVVQAIPTIAGGLSTDVTLTEYFLTVEKRKNCDLAVC